MMLDESTADDGAIYRFYDWLTKRDRGFDLSRVADLREAVRQFDRGDA